MLSKERLEHRKCKNLYLVRQKKMKESEINKIPGETAGQKKQRQMHRDTERQTDMLR